MSPSENAPAVLLVKSPSGAESRLRVEQLPFRIGRHGDNDLVIRDNRASRYHARIVAEGGRYAVEDLKSSFGLFVNGKRVERALLEPGDCIEFGVPDSYQITFELGGASAEPNPASTGSSSLAKLRSTLEVARALESSLSTEDVLVAVVEAALTITGCERGFLLLRQADDLEIRIARSRTGPLAKTDLRVPTRLLLHALNHRREFLSMNFGPEGTPADATERSIYDLELRSVVCVPLVRVRAGSVDETNVLSPAGETVGLLYMDSRMRNADLSAGGRELLTTLALEASTVLENARLLEEQWARQRMEQELKIARQIQESLLPRALPAGGWFRAAVSSIPSLEVGGDYVDIRRITDQLWAAVMADVSGKGVGAAILASLLQGMFLASPYTRLSIAEMLLRANRYLNERTGGEQYATAFYCTLARDGCLHWVNAGHPPPILLRGTGCLESLGATGMPLGMLEESEYTVEEMRLEPGDRIVIFTDGVTEAQNSAREFFGLARLRQVVASHAQEGFQEIYASVRAVLDAFTGGAPQRDDVTLAVLEYRPE
jgi:serine phosphatase RsbU (regulator of sigma subunit)